MESYRLDFLLAHVEVVCDMCNRAIMHENMYYRETIDDQYEYNSHINCFNDDLLLAKVAQHRRKIMLPAK